jgi:hypothetical protein
VSTHGDAKVCHLYVVDAAKKGGIGLRIVAFCRIGTTASATAPISSALKSTLGAQKGDDRIKPQALAKLRHQCGLARTRPARRSLRAAAGQALS